MANKLNLIFPPNTYEVLKKNWQNFWRIRIIQYGETKMSPPIFLEFSPNLTKFLKWSQYPKYLNYQNKSVHTIFDPSDFVNWKSTIWAMEPLERIPSHQFFGRGHFPNKRHSLNINTNCSFNFSKNVFCTTRVKTRGWGSHIFQRKFNNTASVSRSWWNLLMLYK